MEIVKKYFWPVFSLVLLVLVVFQCSKKDNYFEEYRKKEQEKSKRIEDSLIKANLKLESESNQKQVKIDSLEKAFLILEKEVIIINTQTDEKIKAIDNYGAGELQQYFTDRYPEYNK